MSKLNEIQAALKKNSSEDARQSFRKFIPTSQAVYGVRLPVVNELAKQYKEEGFILVTALWKSGAFEERLLAAKILGRLAKKDPAKTLTLIHRFAKDITDWAVCDTLATQAIKPLLKTHRQDIFDLSGKLIASSQPWERRMGIVLLEGYTKDRELHVLIKKALIPVKSDNEYYVKKAVDWMERNMRK